ncbi:MAG TPA: cyclic lactone autoinducer peptide, partial [Firmicutes bacterium]|nr:cyclic lactone autoinducer peptide [Bacillota bacterium]
MKKNILRLMASLLFLFAAVSSVSACAFIGYQP